VALLKERMKVPTTPTAEWVAARIKSLDAAGFKEREQASADLAAAGPAVVPALRAALKDSSAEARSRLEALLARPQSPSPDQLRAVRACEVLEGMNMPEARELLAEWARGPTGAPLTREAAESLDRLRRR
jgi:hypothetical protein